MTPAQHKQASNLGSNYPVTVVAIADGDDITYEVHNLKTGKRMRHWLSTGPMRSRLEFANSVADAAAKDQLDSKLFFWIN